eukprot:TRINITY_DN508_c0_g1_i3.p2 TRINITY_DN508_c0_g1~~TRINITY_DN508_c0_g1_i3.p2  ORF type:complete len:223 (-),score=65.20 TRINITY_DN508_c0_g1_i3:37-705(-)
MTTTPESITTLIESNRYNPDILGELEKYVQYQVDNKTYDFEANQAILKLYQFHPSKVNKKIVATILLKSLMTLPSTNFLLNSYLVSEKVRATTADQQHQIEHIFTMANLLETARFSEFWEECGKNRSYVTSLVPYFEDSIRTFVMGLVGITYQTISKKQLSQAINIQDQQQLSSVISAQGWKESGDFVAIPPSDDNAHSKSKKGRETFSLDQMAKLLNSVSY